jgi:WD40 repeat protein
LKKIGCHSATVQAVIVSGDGKSIASGDQKGGLTWYGDTGESLTQTIKKHSYAIRSLDFSPDRTVLATGSLDKTTKLWCTKTWDVQGNPIKCGADVYCVRYSPSGELLAIATKNAIEIWNPSTRKCMAKFKAASNSASNTSLTWTPDGTRLLSAGSTIDPTIREWDTSIWQQVGDPWRGHTKEIHALAVNSTLVASASSDNNVRLWRLSDRRTIAIFMRSKTLLCVTFSMDGKYILSGGHDKKILEWAVPEDALLQDSPQEQTSRVSCHSFHCCHHSSCPRTRCLRTLQRNRR